MNPSRRVKSALSRLLAGFLPVLLPFIILVGSGFYGLDFGHHWDESLQLRLVDWSVENGIFLPKDFYNYPSMTYWLTLSGIGFEMVSGELGQDLKENVDLIAKDVTVGIRDQIRSSIFTDSFHLRARGIFLIVSASSVLWIYLLQLVWRRSRIEALLTASILGFSWELATHFRWIAPDGILVAFTTMTLLFIYLFHLQPTRKWWLWLAAVSAGFACGTKYPAGLLLVPVLIVSYQSWDRGSGRRQLAALFLKSILIFAASYIVTTPGTLLQPEPFVQDILFEVRHYQEGHVGHTVPVGPQHARLMFTYFTRHLLSRYEILALILSLSAAIGVWSLARESWRTTILFLSFPVLYILDMSTQRVMITRNLLVIAPFMAVLAARGLMHVWDLMENRVVRGVFATLVTALLLTNVAWLWISAETISNRSPERFIGEAAAYLDSHLDSRFFVSDRVWDELGALDDKKHLNVTLDPNDDADYALFYLSEGLSPFDWPANIHNLTVTWFGPWEVNINYYPNWAGDDRILLMSMDLARRLGIQPLG